MTSEQEALQFLRMGRLAEAGRLYQEILKGAPENSGARYFLGIVRYQEGRFDEALDLISASLTANPDANALTAHGNVLQALARFDEALASYDRALGIRPELADAWFNRGVTLANLKRPEDALASYDKALALAPDDAGAWANRATVLLELTRAEEALASVEKSLALTADFAGVWNSQGIILYALGRPGEALAAYEKALQLEPDYAEALRNRADLLVSLRRLPEALAGYDKALGVAPGDARAWKGRGAVLIELRRMDEALASLDKALALQPEFSDALYRRGNLLWAGKHELAAAIGDLEKAFRADPDIDYLAGDLFNLKMQAGDWRGFAAATAAIDAGVRAGSHVIQPLYYLAISDSPADIAACSRLYIEHLYPAMPGQCPGQSRRPGKIRLGYLSADFRAHPTGFLTAGLFESHDKSKFELIGFDNGAEDGSATRGRIKAAFDKFIDISVLSDEAAADRICAEEIDILVDVNGNVRGHRMGVLARRPAPLQVEYLAFPATVGASYMDYVIADLVLIAPEEQVFYSEHVVWLPDTYQPNDSRRPAAPAPPGRMECGLPEQGLVFCNFNHGYKLTPAIFAVWMRILRQTPGSVLWLLENNDLCAGNLRREAASAGVAPERLVFAPQTSVEKHMARLGLADLCLDTLPYNAHTTASDALWAGVPLVTCRGHAFVGRVAASLLQAMNLPELVTDDLAGYEALILDLAGDPSRLGAVRRKVAAERGTAPLFNTERYWRNLESAYATMWDRFQRGEAPQSFAVAAEKP